MTKPKRGQANGNKKGNTTAVDARPKDKKSTLQRIRDAFSARRKPTAAAASEEKSAPQKAPRKARGSIGRPKAETVRDRFVSFRVSEEELLRLIDKARRSGMSHGEFARSRALRGIARGRKETAPMEIDEAMHQLAYEARKQGVNLNQIAHHMNEHQVPPPEGFDQLVAALNAFWDKVTERS